MDSESQKFRNGIIEMAYLISIIFVSSAQRLKMARS
jgi:hypothetical protein